jgi:hypothetical protein
MEDPCAETGGPCDWVTKEEPNGTWDLYCGNCYRWRNWSKDEFDPVQKIDQQTRKS